MHFNAICTTAIDLDVQLLSKSDSYSLQKDLTELAEREAGNEREREREKEGLKKGMNFPFQNYGTTFNQTQW